MTDRALLFYSRLQFLALVTILTVAGLVYGVTVNFWISIHDVSIADATVGSDPEMGVQRTIRLDHMNKYSVTVRLFPSDEFVCSYSPPPFPYSKTATLPKNLTLNWWIGAPEDNECRAENLPAGTYITNTCHTVIEPFGGWVPDKTGCHLSNPFEMKTPDIGQDYLLQEQRALERQIEAISRELEGSKK